MKNLRLVLLLALTGCSSVEVTTYPTGPGSRNAPINAKPRDGVVSYMLAGNGTEDRAEAYKLMAEACNHKYNILTDVVTEGTGFVEHNRQFRTITFRCESSVLSDRADK